MGIRNRESPVSRPRVRLRGQAKQIGPRLSQIARWIQRKEKADAAQTQSIKASGASNSTIDHTAGSAASPCGPQCGVTDRQGGFS